MRDDPITADPRDLSRRPYFEVALVGRGIDPLTVPAEQLAKLILEVVGLLNAVAEERNISLAPVALRAIRKGSATYRLYSTLPERDEDFERVVVSTRGAVEKRGAHRAPRVKGQLRKVWDAQHPGMLRFAARNTRRAPRLRAVLMSEPLAEAPRLVRSTTILHGRVCGMEEVKDRVRVKVKVRDGKKLTMDAALETSLRAAGLFRSDARIRASVLRDAYGSPDDSSWEMLGIEPWHQGDFLQGVDAARQRLREAGVAIDLKRALASLEDEDDE